VRNEIAEGAAGLADHGAWFGKKPGHGEGVVALAEALPGSQATELNLHSQITGAGAAALAGTLPRSRRSQRSSCLAIRSCSRMGLLAAAGAWA
jgi:hypothetical protein